MLSCWIWSKYARLKRINLEFIFEKGLFCFKLLISVDYVNVIEMLRDKAVLYHDTFWRNLVNYEWRRWCTLWVKLISPCLIGVSIRLIVATIPRGTSKRKKEKCTHFCQGKGGLNSFASQLQLSEFDIRINLKQWTYFVFANLGYVSSLCYEKFQ